MKIYKKYDTYKNKQYNILALEYLTLNNIKCKFYAWTGMNANIDFVKTDKGMFLFNVDTKKLITWRDLI